MIRLCYETSTGDFRWAVHDGERWITVRGIRCDVPLETRDQDDPAEGEPAGWMEPIGPARVVIDDDGYAHLLSA